MAHSITPSMAWRKSLKIFDTQRKVGEEDMQDLLEATRLSASSFGLQPWKFVVVSAQDLKEKLGVAGYGQTQFTSASHIVVMCVNTGVDEAHVERFMESTVKARGGERADLDGYADMIKQVLANKTPDEITQWASMQVYIALGTLLAAAACKEIDATPMEGFDREVFDEILDLKKDGFHALVSVALGYRTQDDAYADMKKVRFATDEVISEIS
jgi:nitroreductase / dihydropteridine reductase